MREFDIALANVKQLTTLGVRVLIDDFGTGYSSLARLRDLPVAGVKIDKGFSARLGVDADTDRTLAAVARLAQAMQLEVVVEGIETAAAAERVREFGCDYAQGFHYPRPAALDQLNFD